MRRRPSSGQDIRNPLFAACAFVAASSATFAQPTTSPGSTTAPATVPTTAPAATNVGPRTANDLSREMLAFDERFVVQAYAAHGHRDPAWDADAVKLLRAGVDADACAGLFGGYNRLPEAKDPPPLADRIAWARHIVGTECDDAMVLWFAATAIGMDTSTPDYYSVYRATMQRAVDVVDNAPYCALYRMCIWDTWAQIPPAHEPSAAEIDKMHQRFRAIFRQVLTDKETLPAYRAVVAYRGTRIFDDEDNERADRIGTAVADVAEQADPWLWKLYMGHVEISRAWLSRGNGWGNTVTEEGWRGFRAHLDKAHTLLLEAAELDPALPNPYALLIVVAMGQSSGEEAAFFRKAQQREIDYEPAFNTYRQAIRPRWGGSLATELRFGVSCGNSNRFDSCVPAQIVSIVDDLNSELEVTQARHLNTAELARIAPAVQHAMDGYAQNSPSETVRDWANSMNVAWAVSIGDFARARKLLNDMPYILHAPVMGRGLDPHDVIGNVYALTGPAGPALTAAMAQPDAAERATMLEAAIPNMPADLGAPDSTERARAHSAIAWAKRRLDDARFQAQLDKGDWVPIPFPADLAGWKQEVGTWTVENNGTALVGRSGDEPGNLYIVAPLQLPERCELQCTLEYLGDAKVHNGLLVCPAASQAGSIGVYPHTREHQMRIVKYPYSYAVSERPFDAPADGKLHVHCRYDQGRLTALDDAGEPLASYTFVDEPIRRVAFMTLIDEAHADWRISDLQVRMIKGNAK